MLAWLQKLTAVAWCALVGAMCATPLPSAEIDWAVSLGEAKRTAETSDKLIAVFHLPNPGVTDKVASDANESFLTALVQSNSVLPKQATLKDFVCYRRQVGVPSAMLATPYESGGRKPRLTAPLRRPVIYFCTPQLEVIHFAIGYAAPDYLQQTMQWSLQAWKDIRAEAGAERKERQDWLRTMHFDNVSELDRELFQSTLSQADRDVGSADYITQADVRFYVDAAARLRFLKIRRSLTKQVADAELTAMAHRMAVDGEQSHIAHLISGHLPFVSLEKAEATYYEILADGGLFDPRGKRITALRQQLAKDQAQRRPVLLQVLPFQPRTDSRGISPTPQASWLDNPVVKKRTKAFDQIAVSISELSALLYLRGETAIEATGDSRVAFVFFDPTGNFSGAMFDNEKLKEFSRQLRLASR